MWVPAQSFDGWISTALSTSSVTANKEVLRKGVATMLKRTNGTNLHALAMNVQSSVLTAQLHKLKFSNRTAYCLMPTRVEFGDCTTNNKYRRKPFLGVAHRKNLDFSGQAERSLNYLLQSVSTNPLSLSFTLMSTNTYTLSFVVEIFRMHSKGTLNQLIAVYSAVDWQM